MIFGGRSILTIDVARDYGFIQVIKPVDAHTKCKFLTHCSVIKPVDAQARLKPGKSLQP
jgi:hypothetical protein